MATTVRTKTWVSGDTLTASDLNAEFDNSLGALALVNADISASAAIAASKLDSTVVETDTIQNITGKKTFSDIVTPNNVSYDSKLASGTTVSVIKVGTDNILTIGGSSLDHISLIPGTSKFVKISVLRQDVTTNSYKTNSVILTGWGFQTGNGSTIYLPTSGSSVIITFGIVFDQPPIMAINHAGFKDGSDPTTLNDFASGTFSMHWAAEAASTTTFRVGGQTVDSTNINNGRRLGYSWIAVGEMT